jgi:shikimate dehydrogenase
VFVGQDLDPHGPCHPAVRSAVIIASDSLFMPTTDTITRDTTVCISLAARPSNLGTRFHNFLYDELGLNYLYKAFAPTDIAGAISGIRALGIRGCAVSMPYKEAVIHLVDELDASASAIQSVNTIVNTDGHLRAYNTDYLAVAQLLASHQVSADDDFAVLGSGGMAKAVVAALRGGGFSSGHIIARNEASGQSLADQYGFSSSTQIGELRPRLIINATPIGMSGGPGADSLSFDPDVIKSADTVFDVVAFPAATPLITLAESIGRKTISGAEVIALQAAEQFVLYTGIRPTKDQIARASSFSRA